jgi:hypothetical protein
MDWVGFSIWIGRVRVPAPAIQPVISWPTVQAQAPGHVREGSDPGLGIARRLCLSDRATGPEAEDLELAKGLAIDPAIVPRLCLSDRVTGPGPVIDLLDIVPPGIDLVSVRQACVPPAIGLLEPDRLVIVRPATGHPDRFIFPRTGPAIGIVTRIIGGDGAATIETGGLGRQRVR